MAECSFFLFGYLEYGLSTTDYFKVALEELKLMGESMKQEGKANINNFADLPIFVLMHSDYLFPNLPDSVNEKIEKEWRERQSELANLSSNSEHIIVKNSGHYIQLDQPQVVIGAVKKMVKLLEK